MTPKVTLTKVVLLSIQFLKYKISCGCKQRWVDEKHEVGLTRTKDEHASTKLPLPFKMYTHRPLLIIGLSFVRDWSIFV